MTSTDFLGNIGSRKIIAPVVNFFNSIKMFRIVLEKILSIHRNAKLPKFSSYTAKLKYKNLFAKQTSSNKVAYANNSPIDQSSESETSTICFL